MRDHRLDDHLDSNARVRVRVEGVEIGTRRILDLKSSDSSVTITGVESRGVPDDKVTVDFTTSGSGDTLWQFTGGDTLEPDPTPTAGLTTINLPANVQEGNSTVATGLDSHAEGEASQALGQVAHAEGSASTASGDAAHSEGSGSTASGDASHSEGSGSEASELGAHAEGNGTHADGAAAHAEGSGCTASGDAAHAEGSGTIASGPESHAEGSGSTAIGDGSHAEGGSTASGSLSHAEGSGTTASADYSHAGGTNSTAFRLAEFAQGNGWIPGQWSIVQYGTDTLGATPTPLEVELTDACLSMLRGRIAARKADGSVVSTWVVEGVCERDTATTRLVGTPTITMFFQDAGAAAWTVTAFTASTNGFTLTLTGAAATTIDWSAMFEIVEVR